MKYIRIAVAACWLLAGTVQVAAQTESRALPVLETNVHPRMAAMGNVSQGNTNGMYLYNNLAAWAHNAERIYADYGWGSYPKSDVGTLMVHAANAGYRLGNKHGIAVGFRYWGGWKVPRLSPSGTDGKTVTTYDATVDLGYTYRFNNHWSAALIGSFVNSNLTTAAQTMTFGAQVAYRHERTCCGNPVVYTATAAVDNVGQNIQYTSKNKNNVLPTSVALGGTSEMALGEHQHLAVAAEARYFVQGNSDRFHAGIGAEYKPFELLAVRAGYAYRSQAGYATVGLGLQWKFIQIDAAYQLAKNSDFNMLRAGIGVKF